VFLSPQKLTKRSKFTWILKNKNFLVANILNSRKDTSKIVPRKWVINKHKETKVYVPKPKEKEKKLSTQGESQRVKKENTRWKGMEPKFFINSFCVFGEILECSHPRYLQDSCLDNPISLVQKEENALFTAAFVLPAFVKNAVAFLKLF